MFDWVEIVYNNIYNNLYKFTRKIKSEHATIEELGY